MADINKTTFYRYYTDVDCLFRTLLETVINQIFIKDIVLKDLLENPEVYFTQLLPRIEENKTLIESLMSDNPNFFVNEAESYLRKKLQEATCHKYDNVLMTFIAGGAAHYFISENYFEEKTLIKFCKIIKAITAVE